MRYYKIHSMIWYDSRFIALTPEQQRLFFYLFTCPHGNLLGIFVLREGYVCEDLRISPDDFKRDLTKLIENDFIEYDFKNSVILIKNFLEYNPITNTNQLKSASKIIHSLPKTELIAKFEVLIEGLHEGLSKGLLEVLNEVLFSCRISNNTNCIPSIELTKDIYNISVSKNLHGDLDNKINNIAQNEQKQQNEHVNDAHFEQPDLRKRGKTKPNPSPKHSDDYYKDKDFLKFWELYPRKVGKLSAYKSWLTQKKKGILPPLEQILSAIENQKHDEQWQKNGGEFIPHPTTWLNQGRWDDKTMSWQEKVRLIK